MKRFAKFAPLGAIAAVVLTHAPQDASALQFEYMGKFNGSASINYTRDDSLSGTSAVTRASTPGVFSMREVGNGVNVGDPYTAGVGDFLAWCFDVDKLITTGTALTYELNPAMLDSNPPYLPGAKERVQKLFDKSYDLDLFASTNANQAANSAGFQIAIWEVLYDAADSNGVYNLDDGAYKLNTANAAAKEAAVKFLDGASTFGGSKAWNIALYESESNQNLGVATAIPLPAAAWLLLGVSGALVAAKRRSARKAA